MNSPLAGGPLGTTYAARAGLSAARRVTLSFFGGRESKIEPGEGPAIAVRGIVVFGGIEVKETERRPAAA